MSRLSNQEAIAGYTDAVVFDYVDLQRSGFLSTIGAANQRKVGSLGPGDLIDKAVLIQIVDPAGATDLTLDFGVTASDPDEFIDNLDVDSMTKIAGNTGDAFVGSDSGSPAETTSNVVNFYANNSASAADLIMEFNGTLASLTAGKWALAWNQLRTSELAN